jgi:hypothetical protein
LPVGDSFVRDFEELRAAAAHLDGDIAQGGALELETGRLPVIRTSHGLEFAGRILFEFLD